MTSASNEVTSLTFTDTHIHTHSKPVKQRGEDGHIGPLASKIQKSSVLRNALLLALSLSDPLPNQDMSPNEDWTYTEADIVTWPVLSTVDIMKVPS